MSNSIKISVIFGTRPEAIKLAPVILELKKHKGIKCRVCVTAQHRQMLDQVLEVFGIVPDVDLQLMRPNQTLAGLTARATYGLGSIYGCRKARSSRGTGRHDDGLCGLPCSIL